jgi:hypothetical protein
MPSGRACNALIIELQKNALLLPTAEHIEVLDKSVVGWGESGSKNFHDSTGVATLSSLNLRALENPSCPYLRPMLQLCRKV